MALRTAPVGAPHANAGGLSAGWTLALAAVVFAVTVACGGDPPPTTAPPPTATPEPPCTFLLGFAQLQAQIPEVVGACVANERPDAEGSSQRTTNGLLVWRASDGALGFTDGHRTWARGPDGAVYVRTNDERFPWEAAPPGTALRLVTPGPPVGTPSTPVPVASPAPPPAGAQATPAAPPAGSPVPKASASAVRSGST